MPGGAPFGLVLLLFAVTLPAWLPFMAVLWIRDAILGPPSRPRVG